MLIITISLIYVGFICFGWRDMKQRSKRCIAIYFILIAGSYALNIAAITGIFFTNPYFNLDSLFGMMKS